LNNILSVIKINPLVKNIQNQSNKWVQDVWWTDRDRQTNCHTSLWNISRMGN